MDSTMSHADSTASSSTDDEPEIGPIWRSEDDGEGQLWTPQAGESPPDQRPGRPGRVSCYTLAVRPYRHLFQHSTKVLKLAQELDLEQLASGPTSGVHILPGDDSLSALAATLGNAFQQPCKLVGNHVADLQACWSEQALVRRYGEMRFAVQKKEFDWGPFEVDGRLQLKYYLRMIRQHPDTDWPMYVFESSFEEGREELLSDWAASIPKCFCVPNALWAVPESHCPPGKYFLVGGKRSGSYVHQDPCETSAWNLLLHGRKRWAILPPDAPRHLIEPLLFTNGSKRILNRCPGAWFHYTLPQLRNMDLGLIEFTQYPGETVFVPRGWWHAVLNLDDFCVCATENFIAAPMLESALEAMRSNLPAVAEQWASELINRGWNCCKSEVGAEKVPFWQAPPVNCAQCVA